MSQRTVLLSTFSEYLAYLASDSDSLEDRLAEERDRTDRMLRFPYSVMLQLEFPELDFANRWCWENFGPCDGECSQRDSEYPACNLIGPHSHEGKWTSHWFVKTDYDFGFNEWYFAESADQSRFLANLDNINRGEHYPK